MHSKHANVHADMARTRALSDEDKLKIKEDCDKLYDVLKNCSSKEKVKENLDNLYKVLHLVTNSQGTKAILLRNATIAYLCHHPILPIVAVKILGESDNFQISTYILEVLIKLITKNSITTEIDRKAIRRSFQDPTNFKLLLNALQNLCTNFSQHEQKSLGSDLEIRFLKVINCVYMRKGSSQISKISDSTLDFVMGHFLECKSSKEISRTMLPLIRVLCRNKKNCASICKESFLNAMFSVVSVSNKYAPAISIIRLLSKTSEGIKEMSRLESSIQFIVNTATNHAEKSQSKKYLLGALCRLTNAPNGAIIIAENRIWLALLEFFRKCDRLDETRKRIALIMAYTILHRGVPRKKATIAPLKLDLDFKDDLQRIITSRVEHDYEDSDNEDNDYEDENSKTRHIAMETEDEQDDEADRDSSDLSSEDEDLVSDDTPETIEENRENHEFGKTHQNIKEFFLELEYEKQQNSDKKMRVLESLKHLKYQDLSLVETNVRRNAVIDRQAFPDAVLAESNQDDNSIIPSEVNYFITTELVAKVKVLKGLSERTFTRKVVYDLDNLISSKNNCYDIPKRLHFEKPSIQRKNKIKDIPALRFESRFESGNLRKAEQIDDYEYDLFISPDINLTSGLQWFYFQVSNMLPGKTYIFNIVNFQKIHSQFNYGLQPVMFSVINYTLNSIGWMKMGERIMYFGNEYINSDNEKQFRTLRLAIVFPHEHDYCYLAYHFPYTYTRLMALLLEVDALSSCSFYCRLDRLTDTVNGLNEVPLITITSRSKKLGSTQNRPLVFLTARVHPGESNASWIMDGILRFLSSDNELAVAAREQYIFKIIPMLNPEGVIYGKCCLTGSDLNRCWKKPHPVLHPEIFYAKKLVEYARDRLENQIFSFIDIHGHSRKKFFFLYGCNPKQSWNDADKSAAHSSDTSYGLMAKALEFDENMKINFCRYSIEKKRETTCRVVMWREFGVKHSYTLECSFCSGEKKKKITTQTLRNIGRSIIVAITNLKKMETL